MEQQTTIRTTLEKSVLVNNLPIEFSVGERRKIKFRVPCIEELLTDLDLQMFISIINLNDEQIKKYKMPVMFKTETRGEIAQGFMAFTEYSDILSKYFVKYVENSEFKDKALYISNEKVMSYELNYIIKIMLITSGLETLNDEDLSKNLIGKETEKESEGKLKIKDILEKQKLAEEKLKKAKNKGKNAGYSIEQIMLSISYEFRIPMKELIKLNYYALFWYFGYVAKVDTHKLNQLVISSGFSKKKDYSYWLNK
jgi:hypothetical protein